MWASILIFFQIIKVFLDLWKAKDDLEVKKKSDTAKEIVDAFANADPKERASRLNSIVTDIRMRK